MTAGFRMWIHALRANLWLLPSLLALPAAACPVCQTDTGQQVRQGILDGTFGWNFFVTLLPFPILLGIVFAIYKGVPSPGRLFRRSPGHPGAARTKETGSLQS